MHAQKADRAGNVLLWGLVGVQKEAVLAAKRSIVTVEEIVDALSAPPNAVILPSWVVSAVCLVPGGAFPSYAAGYYARDNAFYEAKLNTARFYIARVLPQTTSLNHQIKAGAATLMALPAEAF